MHITCIFEVQITSNGALDFFFVSFLFFFFYYFFYKKMEEFVKLSIFGTVFEVTTR
jgi:hypothetical protein